MSKTWFITGSARGIGAEEAKAALAVGDTVVATGRDLEQLQKVYAAYGDRVLPLVLDVGDEVQAIAAVDVAVARFERIDVLVNNAGYGQLGLFEEIDHAAFRTDFLDGSSVRYGTHAIGDYGTFGADIEASYNDHSHQQAGDPAKLGKVLVGLASQDNPPLRYLAGSDAVDVATARLARHGAEIAKWRALSISPTAISETHP